MITYKPVQIKATGEVSTDPTHNALGVYRAGMLVAVYINNPESVERKTDRTFGLISMVGSFLLLMGLVVTTTSPLFTLLYVATYLGFTYMIFKTLIYDTRQDVHFLDEHAKAVSRLYKGQVHVVESYYELTSTYPEGTP